MNLSCLALEKEKQVAFPPQLLEAKKACTEPSVFVKSSSTQRAPLVPYNDDVPASDDQRMDKHPDFKVSLSTAGSSKPAAAKAEPLKPVVTKAGLSRSATAKASTVKPANPVVIATLVAFPANVPQRSEAGMIEVLKLRTYNIPTALSYKHFPPVH
ncbi:hypothetical protein C0989_009674 [Termitomyces sp. Mn162]|nr:hypothetical protein C0989_009674 [Termitomyces sp. Mn162]